MAKSTKSSGKRTLIAPHGDKRFVRRNEEGQFTESDDVGRSLSKDVKQTAKTKIKTGQGDKGDKAAKKTSPAKKTSSAKSAAKRK